MTANILLAEKVFDLVEWVFIISGNTMYVQIGTNNILTLCNYCYTNCIHAPIIIITYGCQGNEYIKVTPTMPYYIAMVLRTQMCLVLYGGGR